MLNFILVWHKEQRVYSITLPVCIFSYVDYIFFNSLILCKAPRLGFFFGHMDSPHFNA